MLIVLNYSQVCGIRSSTECHYFLCYLLCSFGFLHTHTHTFNGPVSRTTRVDRYQKGKTNLDFTEARDSEWQWHHLGCVQVCTSLQTDNHASTPPLSFLQSGCPSCHPTNSVKALKAFYCLKNIFHELRCVLVSWLPVWF